MSEVLDELAASDDPLERDLAKALRAYQSIRAGQGFSKSIGYEPRDIRRFGAVGVIERRVSKQSSGFDVVPAELSYEAIVTRYADRFAKDVVAIANERMRKESDAFEPTADPEELDRRVGQLLERSNVPFPKGNVTPQKALTSTTVFLRDPRVKAFVLKRASGRCEVCGEPAPFKTALGLDYLEVHHMKSLADGGSDRVQNAVALCPNCHRGLHHAHDAEERAGHVYRRMGAMLIRE